MAKKAVFGTCHLCGASGKLSFEHVPPEAAFNDRSVRSPDIERIFELQNLDDLSKIGGKQSQRGIGGYTLCESCNSRTGHWYGAHYAAWAYQAAGYLVRSPTRMTLAYPFHILPLRVIKQIICMFFSVNSHHFREAHPDLVRFVLNPREKYFSRTARVFVGYSASDRSRMSGIAGMLSGGTTRVYSEISFPPFSYILDLNQQAPVHEMLDISFFSGFGYDDYRALSLPMPVLSVYTHLPGDFRSREAVLSAVQHRSAESQL